VANLSLNLSLSCILAIWKGIEEFGLTLLNTKHLLYLSKFCRFFASSFIYLEGSNALLIHSVTDV
uniref:hypothetical protein n=1 Tax=Alistipes shahii TaxID=328814 RepID=UPI003AB64AC8